MADLRQPLAELRAHYRKHKTYYHGAAIGVAVLLALSVGLWLLNYFWWSAPAASPKSSDEPDAVFGLLAVVGLFFLVRALLRGTLQICSTIAYVGLLALIVFLAALAIKSAPSALPYAAAGIALSVVLAAFIEIGNRIAFRLSEINSSLKKVGEALNKDKNSGSS